MNKCEREAFLSSLAVEKRERTFSEITGQLLVGWERTFSENLMVVGVTDAGLVMVMAESDVQSSTARKLAAAILDWADVLDGEPSSEDWKSTKVKKPEQKEEK